MAPETTGAGVVAYRALPVSDLPTVDYPTINVNATNDNGLQSTPLVADGVMYVIGSGLRLFALDAVTGRYFDVLREAGIRRSAGIAAGAVELHSAAPVGGRGRQPHLEFDLRVERWPGNTLHPTQRYGYRGTTDRRGGCDHFGGRDRGCVRRHGRETGAIEARMSPS